MKRFTLLLMLLLLTLSVSVFAQDEGLTAVEGIELQNPMVAASYDAWNGAMLDNVWDFIAEDYVFMWFGERTDPYHTGPIGFANWVHDMRASSEQFELKALAEIEQGNLNMTQWVMSFVEPGREAPTVISGIMLDELDADGKIHCSWMYFNQAQMRIGHLGTHVDMTAFEPVAVSNPLVADTYAAWNGAVLDNVWDFIADDYTINWFGETVDPYYQGPVGFARWVNTLRHNFEALNFDVIAEVDQGNLNMTHWVLTGIPLGKEEPVSLSGILLSELDSNGKIMRSWMYYDAVTWLIETGFSMQA